MWNDGQSLCVSVLLTVEACQADFEPRTTGKGLVEMATEATTGNLAGVANGNLILDKVKRAFSVVF